MSTDLEQLFSPDVLAAFDERMRALIPDRPSEERYYSVKRAAEITDYEEGTIRKWLSARKITNYGRPGSPRVKIEEILTMEGR